MNEDEQTKRRRRSAALKAALNKGPAERSRESKMALSTMKHGKNDAENPYSKENYRPGASKR